MSGTSEPQEWMKGKHLIKSMAGIDNMTKQHDKIWERYPKKTSWDILGLNVFKILHFGIKMCNHTAHYGFMFLLVGSPTSQFWAQFLKWKWKLSVLLGMAVDNPRADIAGVHREWEEASAVRQQFRAYGSIFRDQNPSDTPHVNVKGAVLNIEALLPLARRLANRNGDVRMVSIPDLVQELLGLVRTKNLVNFPSPTPSTSSVSKRVISCYLDTVGMVFLQCTKHSLGMNCFFPL